MKLTKARVQNYRSIHDTGWFDIESNKTILVGPNEAGKSGVLRALQTIKMPPGEEVELDALRDFPRARFHEVDDKGDLSKIPVASAVFALDDIEKAKVAEAAPHLAIATDLHVTSYYDGKTRYSFGDEVAMWGKYADVEKPLAILKAYLTKEGGDEGASHVKAIIAWAAGLNANSVIRESKGQALDAVIEAAMPHLDLSDDKIDKAFDAVRAVARMEMYTGNAYSTISKTMPFFVYFSQYFKVRPRIHLAQLAERQAANDIDEEIDFGNICLLKLLNLSAAELSELGRSSPDRDALGNTRKATDEEIADYQDRLDKRDYRLNAASIRLTTAVSEVWGERRVLDISPDGQYLRVRVVNEDGAKVELDQGSEGYRWLVSFYVVFQAQSQGEYKNAILLLDEPGVSLHGLKQKQFRQTVTKIGASNQTLFTTHSPFMVGSEEMDKVRIVEMKDRETGTQVHEDFAVHDPRSLFPLQAHFGYELGQTLFGQHRNLVVEGITDYWYIQGANEAAVDAGVAALDEKVTVVPAGDAGKVVYHATVLHAQELRVAALFDSDSSGQTAAGDEVLTHLLKKKQIIMVADVYTGPVQQPEFEDLLRNTLVKAAKAELGIDAASLASKQTSRGIVDVLAQVGGDKFSKYRLGKAFIRWLRDHGWSDLEADEQEAMKRLFAAANEGTSA